MKFLVFSDAHGNTRFLSRALQLHPDAAGAFFLGDGLEQLESIKQQYPVSFYCVRGNCDFAVGTATTNVLQCMGHKILYTHGHIYQVKFSLERIKAAARDCGADIVLVGHTHNPMTQYDDGLYLMNPGSIGMDVRGGSYGIMELSQQGVMLSNAIIKR